jgi:type II secretory pathway pseudopilin PulG
MELIMQAGNAHKSVVMQNGFTFLVVLAAMFILALGTQKVMTVVSQQAQREREIELLRVGAAFAQAIGAYYESSPGYLKRWPSTLADLTDDKRFVGVHRHLRQVYLDPVTRTNTWGMVLANDGGIAGVYSLSDASTIRTGNLEVFGMSLPAATRYSDWKFVYQPTLTNPKPKS